MSKRQLHTHKRFKSLLKSDPNVCVVQTPHGNWKIHRNLFSQLLVLDCFVRFSDRVAKVADGFNVMIDGGGFYAERIEKDPLTPSIWTNSQTVERQFIYATSGPSVSLLEREREAALQYGLVLLFSRA